MSNDKDIVYEVRIHGRGGQGGVTAAQLCVDAFDGVGVCQPRFGAERMGSPTESFARVSKNPDLVRTNEQVYSPQYVGVLDDSLLDVVNCTAGMPPGGKIVINTCKPIEEIKAKLKREDVTIGLVDATSLALKYLGRNVTNTIILGALIKAGPELFTMEQLANAIGKTFKGAIAQKNMDVIKVAADETKLYPSSVPLDYGKNMKAQWSHVELNLPGFKDLDKAGVWYVKDINGGSNRVNTGSWGVAVAKFHPEFCINCQNCVFICPDFCIKREEKDGKLVVVGVDEFHCKGCASCVEVCPGKVDKETKEKHLALTMTMKC
jgi:pyruvate ferredoxin oxidoreductase gamma subunit